MKITPLFHRFNDFTWSWTMIGSGRLKQFRNGARSKIYLLRQLVRVSNYYDKLHRLARTKEERGRYASVSKNSIQGLMRLSIDSPSRFHYGVRSIKAEKRKKNNNNK